MSKRLERTPAKDNGTPEAQQGFAMPPVLHFSLMFLVQVVSVFALMIPIFALSDKGVNLVLLIVGGIGLLIGVYFLVALLGRLVPARCKSCGSPSRYRGLGWWPFSYAYDCKRCGNQMNFEIRG